ncbi:MAG: pseudouridine synthase [Spirochaetota bacterium]
MQEKKKKPKKIRIKPIEQIDESTLKNSQEKIQLLDKLKEESLLQDWIGSEKPKQEADEYRINRFLAKCGLGSRRKVEALITDGAVKVNGETIDSFATKVNPHKDTVEVSGKPVKPVLQSVIIALNKPVGFLSSHMDVHHEKTVFNLLPQHYRRLSMAGRLDLTSRGLMIFASDGNLIYKLSHPSYKILKHYKLKVKNLPEQNQLYEAFLRGIEDAGEILTAKAIEVTDAKNGIVHVTLKEGRKRQLHRMFKAVGAVVEDLQRIAIGKLQLQDLNLKEGDWQEIQEQDIFLGDSTS